MSVSAKDIVKQLTPPVIISTWARLRCRLRLRPPVFEGIYPAIAAPGLVSGAGFVTTDAIAWAVEKAKLQRDRHAVWVAMGGLSPGDHVLVTLLNLLMGDERFLEVYDLGGGAANAYFFVKPYLERSTYRWFVVEQPALAEAAKPLIAQEARVSIHTRIPPVRVAQGVTRVGLFRTALQYFPDPEATVRELASRPMDYMLFIRLPAGETADYYTIQRLRGALHPFRVFNLQNFVELMRGLGFEVVCRFEERESLDMLNLPAERQLDHTLTLLFARGGVRAPAERSLEDVAV